MGKKDGEADFFEASGKPQQCEPGKPLTFGPISYDRVPSGKSIDLKNWRTNETGATLWVRAGKLFLEPSL